MIDRPATVEITGHAGAADSEGVIEHAVLQSDRVDVTLLLADGSAAEAALPTIDWEWLDLHSGDIVAVRPIIATRLSG